MKKDTRNLIILGILIIIVVLVWSRALREKPSKEEISEVPFAPVIPVEKAQEGVKKEPAEEWGRSPFILPSQKKSIPPPKPLELTLTGISWKKGKALALINDNIVKEGDMIGRKRVAKIEKNRVILVEGKEKYILKLREE